MVEVVSEAAEDTVVTDLVEVVKATTEEVHLEVLESVDMEEVELDKADLEAVLGTVVAAVRLVLAVLDPRMVLEEVETTTVTGKVELGMVIIMPEEISKHRRSLISRSS